MNFIILAVIEIISFFKRKSKIITFLGFIFMWLLMSADVSTHDRGVYRLAYRNITNVSPLSDFEVGYQFVMLISKNAGLSFEVFIRLFTLAALGILAFSIMRLSSSPAFVTSLYLLFPFILDAEQIRTCMGDAIVLLGISFLCNEKYSKVKKMIIYTLLCIIAGLFQVSCLAYLIYGLCFLSINQIKWIIIVISGVLLFIRKFIAGFIIGLNIVNDEKINNYLLSIDTKDNFYLYLAYYSVLIGFVICFMLKGKSRGDLEEYALKLNMLSLLFLPVMYLNPNFERLLRVITLFDYIALSNTIKKKITKYRECLFVLFLFTLAFSRFAMYLTGGGWDRLIKPYMSEGFSLF